MWQRRLKMIGPAEPRALGVNRLMLVAVPATASLIRKLSGFILLLFSALADGRMERLGDKSSRLARHDRQNRFRLQRGQALESVPGRPRAFSCADIGIFFCDCENFHKNYLASALAVCAPCFLNTRVNENSPSLWPTIFS